MRYILLSFLLGGWAFADVDYETLVNQVRAGTNPENIKQEINEKGLAFEIDRAVLRKLTKDGMPDWVIDFLIDWDNPVPYYETPSGGGVGEAWEDGYYPYLEYENYQPWRYYYSPYWASTFWCWNPWWFPDANPWYRPYSSFYYPFGYFGYYSGYHFGGSYRLHGVATPDGFHNATGYTRGHAVRKPGAKATRTTRSRGRTATRSSGSSNGSSRSLSSTRSSSSSSSRSSSSSKGTATRRQ